VSKEQLTANLFAQQQFNDHSEPAHIIRVAFESGVDSEFDYGVADDLWPVEAGARVEAPFGRGNKNQVGFCVAAGLSAHESFADRNRLKYITKVLDDSPLVDAELMELARWISGYYVCPLGQVLGAMVPAGVKRAAGRRQVRYMYLLSQNAQKKQIKSRKQQTIIEILQELEAFDTYSAGQLDDVLREADCSTDGPVKRLVEKGLVKLCRKTEFRKLPVIPEGLRIDSSREVSLNNDQAAAVKQICSDVETELFGVTLLWGITDSGKTEVYMRVIEQVIASGKNAIVLLPEIALTAQTVQRFQKRFSKVAVLHSGLTAAQRNAQWQMIRSGQAEVVIGARSAIFAPVPRLGLVVVDEEHEPSYKQDTVPRYHGRDVAIKRAQIAGAHCVLGSATPSLESLVNCTQRGHYKLVKLPKRVMDLPMPKMRLVDLRQDEKTRDGRRLLSSELTNQLKNVLGRGEQAILLLNKRGYSNFIFCSGCKHSLKCRNCDTALTFHKRRPSRPDILTVTGKHKQSGYAICHYCLAKTLVPQNCPLCDRKMIMIGVGSQRLEEELSRKFPDARVARIDSDSMAGKDYYKLLNDFSKGQIDILAGTQMLAKGLHFPNVTLVGIVSADTSLYVPDFRVNERTFQLISQVAGRTGRSEKKGLVVVQTFLPDQPAIQFALANDFDGFARAELVHRRACNLPPYWRMAAVLIRGSNYEKLQLACESIRNSIDGIISRNSLKAEIRGPMPAPISRIQRLYRMQIIVEAPDAGIIRRLFERLRSAQAFKGSVQVQIDIDPVNLL